MKFDWLKIKSCVIARDAENNTNKIRFTARNVVETERNSAHAAIMDVILSGLVECNLVTHPGCTIHLRLPTCPKFVQSGLRCRLSARLM